MRITLNLGNQVLTQDGLLKLPVVMNIEELASAERKDHALVVLLQLIVDLGRDQSRELALRKRLIFVESLTIRSSLLATVLQYAAMENIKEMTYI